jgi:hypothetical protein
LTYSKGVLLERPETVEATTNGVLGEKNVL